MSIWCSIEYSLDKPLENISEITIALPSADLTLFYKSRPIWRGCVSIFAWIDIKGKYNFQKKSSWKKCFCCFKIADFFNGWLFIEKSAYCTKSADFVL